VTRYLLDTHAFLWALSEPEKLSTTARRALTDPAHGLWVSSVSFFEIATKARSGKLKVPDLLLDRWDWTLSRLNAHSLSLDVEDAIRAGRWPSPHRDPFDRLLAAQAVCQDMELVSCDSAFGAGFTGLRICW
jgi:PIN domain nuclease of toxin-antitoxin system